MDGFYEKLLTESNVIVILLLVAIVYIWREWLKERKSHVDALMAQTAIKEKYVEQAEKLRSTLESHTQIQPLS